MIKLIYLIIFFTTLNIYAGGSVKGKILIDNEGLNNVVVYLEPDTKINFNPPKEPALIDQINLSFVPHVLPVMKGTKVLFPNSDKIRHSVFSTGDVKNFDLGTYPPGAEKSIICDTPGIIPVLCYIHHDMSAYIVVLETPYFSTSDDDGNFLIENIPAGKYKLSFWHEDTEIESENVEISENKSLIKNIIID